MLRSLCYGLLAFACLFSMGNSDLELLRDVRNQENQALVQKYYDAHSTLPPLLSPGLVASLSAPAEYASPSYSYSAGSGSGSVYGSDSSTGYVDVAASDDIARHILTFAQNLSNQINSSNRKTTVFSPLSIMSALALLLLGAKGRSYTELIAVFGQSDMVKLHEQFGLMLQDVQQPTRQTTSPQRQLDAWHSNSIRRSLRTYPRNRNAPQEVHVANGLFLQYGYSLNPDYR